MNKTVQVTLSSSVATSRGEGGMRREGKKEGQTTTKTDGIISLLNSFHALLLPLPQLRPNKHRLWLLLLLVVWCGVVLPSSSCSNHCHSRRERERETPGLNRRNVVSLSPFAFSMCSVFTALISLKNPTRSDLDFKSKACGNLPISCEFF